MASDLQRERQSTKLEISELTTFLDGGNEKLSRRRKLLLAELASKEDPHWKPEDVYFRTPDEGLEEVAKNLAAYAREKGRTKLDETDKIALSQVCADHYDMDGVHGTMFIPILQMMASDEQKEKWLTLAMQYKILGTYAQTELGHGSNVRGLETTATYDADKQEFVLNTPTVTAHKFWPGGLGNFTTHAVVYARLITQGVDYGVHPFIVQLRSLENYYPLPGITLGDIGPKMGMAQIDNGFLSLDHIHIPRDQMLMRFSRVEPDGSYVRPPAAKVSYGAMVKTRVGIVVLSAWHLSKAITIAVRYSIVRKQGQLTDGGPECQVIDYQTQQLQLFPLLASAYVLKQLGYYIIRQYTKMEKEIYTKGNFDGMQELHASSSGMKAFTTFLSTQGIETCRQACGGHGYSRSSGLPDMYLNFLPSVTYEGVNTILYLQTAKYLKKMLSSKKKSSSLPSNVSYLGSDFVLRPCNVRKGEHFLNHEVQLDIYQQRASRMVRIASGRLQRGMAQGLKYSDAWNESSCDWETAANAHCHYIALKSFRDSLSESNLSPVNMAMMDCLGALFATHGIISRAGEFMTDGYMTPVQIALAREQMYALFEPVRREAVSLVDAFDHSDRVLCSTLGRYDGDVYKALLDWAKKAPRNKDKVHPVYKKYLKNLLQSKL